MSNDSDARHKRLADLSERIYGHRHVLPVATAIEESGAETVTQAEVTRNLEGRSPPNKILHALARLEGMGALSQLPYLGRPSARTWDKVKESAFWPLALEYAAEVDAGNSMKNGSHKS